MFETLGAFHWIDKGGHGCLLKKLDLGPFGSNMNFTGGSPTNHACFFFCCVADLLPLLKAGLESFGADIG